MPLIGRPSSITKTVLHKLEYAFSIGCTDREACIYADIAPSTLYKYCEENHEFSERKEQLKEKPVLAARMAVMKAIQEGNAKLAWAYLERKRRDEFGPHIKAREDRRVLTLQEIEEGIRQEEELEKKTS